MGDSSRMDPRLHLIHPKDNVLIALEQLSKGTEILIDSQRIPVPDNVPVGFKIARNEVTAGANVFKYGMPIGRASRSIAKGGLIHTHNIVSLYIPEDSGFHDDRGRR
jgi:altronate dehydratase small subunit